ncbi:4-hydroxybenzoate transporter [Pseudomonas syringae]|uniref:4-hydroxybenzoate transporter n=1 Tax=Pseudomonas syringae TaxID=317 RepID=A0A1C7Z3F0_PSESX|nr:aromatic acid/H+ symport family MFS transporter [Pseudomonas syringae]OCR23507.1 4-hydroxybenzoate transporter [Pseudomonas syringae]
MHTPAVDIKQWIDGRSVSRYQWLVLLLCFLIVTFDGLDAAIMGFIAPAVIQDWNISRTAFGPIMASAMVGLAVGALVSGPYSDRLGRRRVLLWSVAAFGLFSVACAFARSPMELAALRFLTGLGLGAAMPNSTTLLSEYIPQRLRGLLITLMFMGFGLGSASGGFVSAWMVPQFGWHAVLLLGGVLPLLLLPVLYFLLPESVDLMINRGFPRPRILTVLRRMGGQFADDVVFATSGPTNRESAGSKVRHLFTTQYRWRTISLWCTYFMGLVVIYLLTGWMPTLIKDAGVSLERAAIVTAMFQFGGLIGIVLVGFFMDRLNPKAVIALAYVGGAACIFALGFVEVGAWALGVLVFASGFCINGAQTGLNAFAPGQYPTDFRATGVSWMLGIGRFGGILASMSGGALLSLGLPMSVIFAVLGVPAVLAAIAIMAGPRATSGQLQAQPGH